MRAVAVLSALFLLLVSSLAVHADLLPESVISSTETQASDTGNQAAFLNTTLVLDTTGEPSGWMLAPSSSGVSFCDSAENANCLTTADLVSRLTIRPSAGHDDPIRNNLPEPATWLLIAGGVPLLWGRVKNLTN